MSVISFLSGDLTPYVNLLSLLTLGLVGLMVVVFFRSYLRPELAHKDGLFVRQMTIREHRLKNLLNSSEAQRQQQEMEMRMLSDEIRRLNVLKHQLEQGKQALNQQLAAAQKHGAGQQHVIEQLLDKSRQLDALQERLRKRDGLIQHILQQQRAEQVAAQATTQAAIAREQKAQQLAQQEQQRAQQIQAQAAGRLAQAQSVNQQLSTQHQRLQQQHQQTQAELARAEQQAAEQERISAQAVERAQFERANAIARAETAERVAHSSRFVQPQAAPTYATAGPSNHGANSNIQALPTDYAHLAGASTRPDITPDTTSRPTANHHSGGQHTDYLHQTPSAPVEQRPYQASPVAQPSAGAQHTSQIAPQTPSKKAVHKPVRKTSLIQRTLTHFVSKRAQDTISAGFGQFAQRLMGSSRKAQSELVPVSGEPPYGLLPIPPASQYIPPPPAGAVPVHPSVSPHHLAGDSPSHSPTAFQQPTHQPQPSLTGGVAHYQAPPAASAPYDTGAAPTYTSDNPALDELEQLLALREKQYAAAGR